MRKLKLSLLVVLLLTAWVQPTFSENDEFLHPFIVDVQKAIEKYLGESLEVKQGDLFIEFSMIDTTYSFIRWDEIQVIPNRRGAKKGVQMIKYGLFRDGKLKKDFSLKIRVSTVQNVVVTAQYTGRQHIFEPENVELQRRETTKVRGVTFTSIDDVLGLRTKRIVMAGEILTQNVLEEPPLIPNGAKITIQFNNGGVEVEMPGKARQDGYLGKKVLVKCTANNRSYNAKVVNAKTVRVEI